MLPYPQIVSQTPLSPSVNYGRLASGGSRVERVRAASKVDISVPVLPN